MSKEERKKHIDYVPISLEYFLDMVISGGAGGKEIINQNETLKTIKDIVNFFSNKENLNEVRKKINSDSWHYFNCPANITAPTVKLIPYPNQRYLLSYHFGFISLIIKSLSSICFL